MKAYTEGPIRQGVLESPWEGLAGGVVLGESGYARRLLAGRKVNEEEQTPARRMRRRCGWGEVVRAAGKIRGESWSKWAEQHGDWGRDGVMYRAVRYGGMRLSEVVREVGLKYQAVAQGVKRLAGALVKDPERRAFVLKLKHQLSTI